MRAKLVVFPVKGRNWCFARSLEPIPSSQTSSSPTRYRDLWRTISNNGIMKKENVETVADFFANKMSRAWTGLQNAPEGSIKSKFHSLGVKLLSRVTPTEIFLKSVTEDVRNVEVSFPSNLNPRLVRRRLRHVALRGSAIHKKNFYGAVVLAPITSAFAVLPLPNIPFFWIVFRAYSNWRAFKGSERLKLLVSDCSKKWSKLDSPERKNELKDDKLTLQPPWVLKPSKDLQRLLAQRKGEDSVSKCTISRICETFHLEKSDVLKYTDRE